MNLESKYIKYLSKNYKLQFGGWKDGDSFVVHDPESYPNNDGPSGKVLYKNDDGTWHVMYGNTPSDIEEKFMIPLIENTSHSSLQPSLESNQQPIQPHRQPYRQPRRQPRQQPQSSMSTNIQVTSESNPIVTTNPSSTSSPIINIGNNSSHVPTRQIIEDIDTDDDLPPLEPLSQHKSPRSSNLPPIIKSKKKPFGSSSSSASSSSSSGPGGSSSSSSSSSSSR